MTNEDLIARLKDALNTEEDGEALIEVARNACRAEMALANFERRFLNDEMTLEAAHARLQIERAGG